MNDFDGWFCGPTSGGAKFVSMLPSARMWARPLTWTSFSLAKLPPTNQPPAAVGGGHVDLAAVDLGEARLRGAALTVDGPGQRGDAAPAR